jgi:hypothetical protein
VLHKGRDHLANQFEDDLVMWRKEVKKAEMKFDKMFDLVR